MEERECSNIRLPTNVCKLANPFVQDSDFYEDFRFEEYVDFPSNRSTLRVWSKQGREAHIYYNDILSGHYFARNFFSYDISLDTCKTEVIDKWPHARFRRLLIQMLINDELANEMCDVAIGPSALLVAIDATASQFSYVDTRFSEENLIDVDIYERVIDADIRGLDDDHGDKLLITVEATNKVKSAKKGRKKKKSMADVAGDDDQINVTQVYVCRVTDDDLKQRKSGVAYDCDYTNVELEVRYELLGAMHAGTLIGGALGDHREIDLNREPFMRPVGLGCFEKRSLNVFKRLRVPDTNQFSTLYTSTHGEAGKSHYIAFDGKRKAVRIDRYDWKTVVDIERQVAYNIDIDEATLDANKQTISRQQQQQQELACIVYEPEPKLHSSMSMEHLLGIGPKCTLSDWADYLGTKHLDHVEYEVYEKELKFNDLSVDAYSLPLILEPATFTMPNSDSSKSRRFFVTYYVSRRRHSKAFNSDDPDNDDDDVLVPKYIELWEMSVSLHTRSLINRVEIEAFAWSLDVLPVDDSRMYEDKSQLMRVDECAENRSKQALVKYRITQTESDRFKDAQLVKAFKQQNPFELRENLLEYTALQLRVSRMHIAELDYVFRQQDTAAMLVEARLWELRAGFVDVKQLGYIRFGDMIKSHQDDFLQISTSRHSMQSCELELMKIARSTGKKAIVMHCASRATCVVIDENALLDANLKFENEPRDEPRADSSGAEVAYCRVSRFNWKPTAVRKENSVLYNAYENRHRVSGTKVELPFVHNGKPATYKGYSYAATVAELDSLGSGAVLSNFRYTTLEEDPDARNTNLGLMFALARDTDDLYRQCAAACAQDEYCESFSTCSKTFESRQSACVLSSLRITSARTNEIKAMTRDIKSSDVYAIKSNFGDSSQIFRIKRQDACAIHARDALAAYKLDDERFTSASESTDAVASAALLPQSQIGSVEECARAHLDEFASSMGKIDDTFYYCPMSSACLTSDATWLKLIKEPEICQTFKRNHKQFYQKIPSTHFSLRVKSDKEGASGEENIGHDEMARLKVGHTLATKSAGECARLCNMRTSGCLSFDVCKAADSDTKWCMLYALRSPFVNNEQTAHLGWLPQEKEFGLDKGYDGSGGDSKRDKRAVLTGSSECSHYPLYSKYLEPRLETIRRVSERRANSNFDTLETGLIAAAHKAADAQLSSLLRDPNASGGGSASSSTTQSDGSHTNGLLILFALAIACAGTLFKDKIYIYSTDLLDAYRARRADRFAHARISQVALSANFD